MSSNTLSGEARSQTESLYEYEASWTIERHVAWRATMRHGGVWRADAKGVIAVPAAGSGGIGAAVRDQVEAAIFELEDLTQPSIYKPLM
jgi:hypothetical protein